MYTFGIKTKASMWGWRCWIWINIDCKCKAEGNWRYIQNITRRKTIAARLDQLTFGNGWQVEELSKGATTKIFEIARNTLQAVQYGILTNLIMCIRSWM
jgi:hypothetical protein